MSRHRSFLVAAGALLAQACSDGDPWMPGTDASAATTDAATVLASLGDAATRTDGEAARAEAGGLDATTTDGRKAPPPADATTSATSPDAAVTADAPLPPTGMLVGSAGGTLMLNEGKLFIPPGALARDTVISFRLASNGYPALPGRAASSVVALEPHGLTFAAPVRLTLYHFGGAARVALFSAPEGGAFAPVEGATITLNTAEAALRHFSYFVVGPAPTLIDGGAASADPDSGSSSLDAGRDATGEGDASGDLGNSPDGSRPTDLPVAADALLSAPDSAPAATSPLTVRVGGELASFVPRVTTIKVGDAVTWVWDAGNHSIVSGGAGGVNPGDCANDGKFSANPKGAGESFKFTFTARGTYGYHCAAHCVQFEGGVIVVN